MAFVQGLTKINIICIASNKCRIQCTTQHQKSPIQNPSSLPKNKKKARFEKLKPGFNSKIMYSKTLFAKS